MGIKDFLNHPVEHVDSLNLSVNTHFTFKNTKQGMTFKQK